jgi:hypothetical protein
MTETSPPPRHSIPEQVHSPALVASYEALIDSLADESNFDEVCDSGEKIGVAKSTEKGLRVKINQTGREVAKDWYLKILERLQGDYRAVIEEVSNYRHTLARLRQTTKEEEIEVAPGFATTKSDALAIERLCQSVIGKCRYDAGLNLLGDVQVDELVAAAQQIPGQTVTETQLQEFRKLVRDSAGPKQKISAAELSQTIKGLKDRGGEETFYGMADDEWAQAAETTVEDQLAAATEANEAEIERIVESVTPQEQPEVELAPVLPPTTIPEPLPKKSRLGFIKTAVSSVGKKLQQGYQAATATPRRRLALAVGAGVLATTACICGGWLPGLQPAAERGVLAPPAAAAAAAAVAQPAQVFSFEEPAAAPEAQPAANPALKAVHRLVDIVRKAVPKEPAKVAPAAPVEAVAVEPENLVGPAESKPAEKAEEKQPAAPQAAKESTQPQAPATSAEQSQAAAPQAPAAQPEKAPAAEKKVPVVNSQSLLGAIADTRGILNPLSFDAKTFWYTSFRHEDPPDQQGWSTKDFFEEEGQFTSPLFGYPIPGNGWEQYKKETGPDGKPEYVLVDTEGPGVISYMAFTQWDNDQNNHGPFDINDPELVIWGGISDLGNIRISIDGKSTLDVPVKSLISGEAIPGTAGLCWRHGETGTNGCAIPITFGKSIRIATTGRPRWPYLAVTKFPPETKVKSFDGTIDLALLSQFEQSRQDPARLPELNNLAKKEINQAVNKDAPLVAAFESAGTLGGFQVNVPKGAEGDLWLQVLYNDEDEPAISLPLRNFFTSDQQMVAFDSQFLGVKELKDSWFFYSNLPIPFGQKGGKVIITRNSDDPVNLASSFFLSKNTSPERLRMWVDPGTRLEPGSPKYEIKLNGKKGKVVALFLDTKDFDLDKTSNPKWRANYMESDVEIIADGERRGVIAGLEDLFNGGYYFRWWAPWQWGRALPGGLLWVDSRDDPRGAGFFRLFPGSEVTFENDLTLSFEHGFAGTDAGVTYAAKVVYYSQDAPK